MIHIANTGYGNLNAIVNMVKRTNGEVKIVEDVASLEVSEKIILPGIGSFDTGMESLRKLGFDEAIREAANRGAYILGICLGMQLLFNESEEGQLPGLGLIPGTVQRFRTTDKTLKIPHMGWNEVHPVRESSLFFLNDEERRFYFVHSYHARCSESSDIAATAMYGYEFTCAVQRDRILGVQFHPEKSHRFGLALIKKYVELPCLSTE